MVDAVSFLGRFIGGIFSIFFPFESLKFAYTVQSIINSSILALTFILMYEVEVSLVKPILLISMLISGMMRSLSAVPRVLLFNNSNPQEDKIALSIWNVVFLLGDVVSLLLVNWLMELPRYRKAAVNAIHPQIAGSEGPAFNIFHCQFAGPCTFRQLINRAGHVFK